MPFSSRNKLLGGQRQCLQHLEGKLPNGISDIRESLPERVMNDTHTTNPLEQWSGYKQST